MRTFSESSYVHHWHKALRKTIGCIPIFEKVYCINFGVLGKVVKLTRMGYFIFIHKGLLQQGNGSSTQIQLLQGILFMQPGRHLLNLQGSAFDEHLEKALKL